MPFSSKGSSQTINQISERFDTDRFGVDTIELLVEVPDSLFPGSILQDFAPHPRFSSMALQRRSGQRSKPGWWSVSYQFEGFLFSLPEPTYELVASLSMEPLQTHPDFVQMAGTPAAPLNGAIFIDPDNLFRSEKENAIFKEFANTGGANIKSGVDSYMEPGAEWRETRFSVARPTGLKSVGSIDTPNGSPPALSGRDWLLWSETYFRRGHIYQIQTTWKLSGRNGWDQDIYS